MTEMSRVLTARLLSLDCKGKLQTDENPKFSCIDNAHTCNIEKLSMCVYCLAHSNCMYSVISVNH